MKHAQFRLALASFLLSCILTAADHARAQEFSEDPDRGGAERQREFFARLYEPYSDGLPREYLDRTWKDIRALPAEPEAASNPSLGWHCIGPFGFNSNYIPLGPTRWMGRVLDLELHQSGLMRFAAASGGLWESMFGAAPISDRITSLAIGSFSSSPADRNTIVVGTGEIGTVNAGTGLWKTTDGGGSWKNLPVPGVQYVNKVRFDPVLPGFVHAATNLGYYLSTDNGENWTRTYTGNVYDLAFASNAADRLIYIVTGGTGIWRSTNDGQSFTRVNELPGSGYGRGAITAARPVGSPSSMIYVTLSTGSGLLGIYRSDNAGYAWSDVTPPGAPFGTGQTYYNQAIGVCPTDPSIVLVGWVKLYRSSDAGQSWVLTDNLNPNNHDRTHDDWHNILWTGGSRVYAANDGGIFYSDDYGVTWGPALAYTVAPITQFYNFDIGESDNGVVYGGTQDVGIVGTTTGGAQWLGTQCCDAAGVSVDPFDASKVYGVIGSAPPPRGGGRNRSTDFGLTWTPIDGMLGAGTVIRNDRFPPVQLYTDNGTRVMTSIDRGDTWTALNPTPFPANTSNITVGRFSSGGSGAAVYAPLESFGLRVYDQGTWYDRSAGLPVGLRIRKVVPHPREYFVAYALMQGVQASQAGSKIFKTTNRGQTWTNITGNLPNLPLVDLVPHPTNPNSLYLGTAMGCYKTTNGGNTWFRWNYGMPEATIISEMKFIDSLAINGKFYVGAATYGRSIWLRDESTEDPIVRRFHRPGLYVPITDNTTVRDTIHVPLSGGNGTVLHVSLTLDSLLHTFDGSLTVTLLHAGVRDTLVQGTGGEGHNFIATTLDDDASLGLAEALPPFTGTFRPVQPLGVFDGLPAAGEWVLEIHDGQPGNTGELHAWSLEIHAATQEIRVGLTGRWNLVSVPLVVEDSSLLSLFPSARSQAYSFNHGYVSSEELGRGKGYWVKFDGPDTAVIVGLPIQADTIDVEPGWNLIGSISTPVPVAGIGSIPPGLVVSNFFEYADGGYATATAIGSGRGYWVKASQSGRLVLSSIPGTAPGKVVISPTAELPPPPPLEKSASNQLPADFSLDQNYPNPFNPVAEIGFRIAEYAHVNITVYDLLGRAVTTLVDEACAPGSYAVQFNGSNLASGTYLYRMRAGGFTATRRMMLVK